MKAYETKIDEFLATNKTTFAIPVYQRNYDWNLLQCKQLFQDIVDAGNDSQINAHFIGSIVYVHDGLYTASGLKELTIIDGQQRLTTITLIYMALYRLAQDIGDQQLENEIHETYLINKFAQDAEKLKLKPTENNMEALRHILNSSELDEFKGYSKIIENFEFFRHEINADNYETIQKGLSKLIFVEISLERPHDNPQRIFESLNSTGLELSQADLIRNYILMGLKRDDQDKIYKNYWDVIERNAKDETLNESKVSKFIRDYLTLKNKEIPNEKKVYATFKAKYPTTTIDELEVVLADLKSLVKYYNRLCNPENESDREIRSHLEWIKRLEINVAFPFMMKVYEDYSNNIINKSIFISVLSLVQSFTFRRFILGLPTHALGKIFMGLYEKAESSSYLPSLQKALLQRSGAHRFPRNTEIINALKERDVYSFNSKNRTYLFERLENYQNNEPVTIEGNSDITIEHIFPQNPDPKWKIELGADEYTFIKENYLNTIGNLTLSGNNGKLCNKSFVEKREMDIDGGEQGYKFSRLWLNRDLKLNSRWGKLEIEKRADTLSARFLDIWEFPDIQIEVKNTEDEVNIFDAEDPTGKKLDYAIFFEKKLEVADVTKLYTEVIKQLFELQSETFFAPEISKKIILSKNPTEDGLKAPARLNDTYFIDTNLSNIEKFKRIKLALTILGIEDELLVKYADQ